MIGEYEEELVPKIDEFKCTDCGLTLPEGWGGCLYVEKEKKRGKIARILHPRAGETMERIYCPHPSEHSIIIQVLGTPSPSRELINQKVGFLSHCICLDCLRQFNADYGHYYYKLDGLPHKDGVKPEKDKRECPNCKSQNVRTEMEMVDQYCPKCKKGVISRKWTYAVS